MDETEEQVKTANRSGQNSADDNFEASEHPQEKNGSESWEQIAACINEHGGIVKREEFNKRGISYRKILDYVEHGDLVRIKSGYYTDRLDRFSEEELVSKLFPDTLLCMESALYAYGYITQKPYGWRLAVDKNTSKSRFKMDYPVVVPYYTEPDALKVGASKIEIEGYTFGIYDRERVICDCLKNEDKMDRENFKQAVQSYLKEPQKDISALLEYAKERRVMKKVQSMIGVWL